VYAGMPRALDWTCWLRVVLNQSVRQPWQKVCPQLAKRYGVHMGWVHTSQERASSSVDMLKVFCFVLAFSWSMAASRRRLSLRNLSRSCSSSWHRCCSSVSRCRCFAGFSSDISSTSSGFTRLCFREVRLGANLGSSSSSDEMTMTGIL